jgi:two-component system, NtrC family, response regulator AtoC
MTQKSVLVADDDAVIRGLLVEFLSKEGFEVQEARTGSEVLSLVGKGYAPGLILMDIRMPELSGMEVLRRLKEQNNSAGIIVMTAFGTSNLAIQAIQLGAFDYITKPFELDEVLLAVQRCFDYRLLQSEVLSLRRRLGAKDPAERIVGRSPKMLEVYKTIGRIAGTDATVLISGETGTGKELVAEVVHQNSPYRSGSLIKVACASLPETLLESELFGHEKGSFTSAYAQRKGRFELADKGTIFLDEIGEMTLATQKKLLRVLQEKEFERVGGTQTLKVDCRVVAATNRNLAEEVNKGRFREDLYYRLNVISIHMPPLRERTDDIPLLVEHFLDKHRFRPQAPPAKITVEAIEKLEEHDWPGNVRELENTVERAVILSAGEVIRPDHLLIVQRFNDRSGRPSLDFAELLDRKIPLSVAVAEFERRLLQEAYERAGRSEEFAAAMLGIDVHEFLARSRECGLPFGDPATARA